MCALRGPGAGKGAAGRPRGAVVACRLPPPRPPPPAAADGSGPAPRPHPAAVRLLREELQLLQEPGSYVGEVIKVRMQ